MSDSLKKKNGQFYTPEPLADFLANWAVKSGNEKVLDPGCGDGNILKPVAEKLGVDGSVVGIDIDEQGLEEAKEELFTTVNSEKWTLHKGDFFDFCLKNKDKKNFDVVVGNPPFIRYQDFDSEKRERAIEILNSANLPPTKQMNAWMPFLVGSTQLLRKKGRIVMIVPAALLQVKYAGELRKYLADSYSRLTLVTFEKLVFDGIQEEVVLLLGERNGNENTGINLVELCDETNLQSYNYQQFGPDDVIELDHSSEKWTMYYLNQEEVELIRRLKGGNSWKKIGKYSDVRVGVVTGRNVFFVLDSDLVDKHALQKYTRPIVSRSSHLGEGIKFCEGKLNSNTEEGKRTQLLDLPEKDRSEFSSSIQKYISEGEEEGYHEGHKCSIRDYWYSVPSTWTPDGFLLRQIHRYPKFVLNKTEATCTDTIHRVNYKGEEDEKRSFFAATHNSMTWAFSELYGRSYAEGVLELSPNEAERLPIPTKNWEKIELDKVDQLIKEEDPETVLDYTDRILLKQGMGLSEKDVGLLRGIWSKLSERRINRH